MRPEIFIGALPGIEGDDMRFKALILMGMALALSACASGANMREAEITVTLPPGMTAVATVDAEGRGVPAVQINIGNTTRTVDIETAREATATLPMGAGAAGL